MTATVSRETDTAFQIYSDMLVEWQGRFNLVAPSTLGQIRERHIEDSAQLVDLVPAAERAGVWVDFGSGAGFPGLVIAILVPGRVHLVESIAKKCLFLQAVVDRLGLSNRVTVHNRRAESMAAPKADIITARACAALPKLFDWGSGFAAGSSLWLLPKGETVADEIAQAQQMFDFDYALADSRTDARGRIVMARHVRPKSKGRRR